MADVEILGLFHEAEPTADTLVALRELGVREDQMTVLSGMPYRAEMLGRRRARVPLVRIAGLGAVLGLLTAAFLSVGLFLLYPLEQGGQPIIPIPPTLIVFFEVTMLGIMWATFFGLLLGNRLPAWRSHLYDPRITEGHVGVLAEVDEAVAPAVWQAMERVGAHHMNRQDVVPEPRHRFRLFWGVVVAILVVLGAIVLLLTYEVIKIPFPTNMFHQASVGYEEGPRLAAPAAAVPVEGPVFIAGKPATEPVPATEGSVQRGQVLYGIDCAVCHGAEGMGNGTLSGFFSPRPADLTSQGVHSLSDAEIYTVINLGRGDMPSLGENLSREQGWDVVNHVRTWQP